MSFAIFENARAVLSEHDARTPPPLSAGEVWQADNSIRYLAVDDVVLALHPDGTVTWGVAEEEVA